MLNFLSNLGSGVARLGSAFGHGAASIGKGIGRGVRRLGELGEDDDQVALYRTPDFNQNAGRDSSRSMIDIARGPRVIEDFVTAAEDDARADSLLERRNLPIPLPSPPGGPPPLTPAPSLNELRSALPSLSSRPSPPLAAPPAAPKAVPDLVPDMDLDWRNLPIPRLPGHSGGPISYNSIDAAKYDSVMKHAKRDAEGNFIGGFNRDWKTIAQNLLRGAAAAASSVKPGEDPLGRALGGAITAGAGSAINPQAGYEFAFDVGERPKIEAEMARERAEKDRMVAEIFNQAKLDDLRATTEERRAQARKLDLPERRPVNRTIGINRRTGRREFFDASDPSQLALYDPEPPKSAARGQMRLGRNINTGELDYYDPSDPEQAGIFRPDRLPTPESGKNARQPGGVLKQLGEITKQKRKAQNAWGAWSKETDPTKREQARIAASEAQAQYNDAVRTLGEAFPDEFEVGGFAEQNGGQGWSYYKRREGGGQAPPQGGRGAARPSVYKRNVNELPPLR